MKKIVILIVVIIIIGVSGWWIYQSISALQGITEAEAKSCKVDSDCLVFGEDGVCNCGCFNKDYQWEKEGDCFCAAPQSCKCVDDKCEGFFGEDETADWQTYNSVPKAEYEYEKYIVKYPKDWTYKEDRAEGTHTLGTFFMDSIREQKVLVEVDPSYASDKEFYPFSDCNEKVVILSTTLYNCGQPLKFSSYVYETDFYDGNRKVFFIFHAYDKEGDDILNQMLPTFKFIQ